MRNPKLLLPVYNQILDENRLAQFQECKHIQVSFNEKDSINQLWSLHDAALTSPHTSEIPPKQSLLDLKIEIAKRVFSSCCFCERRCLVDRTKDTGWCNVKKAAISSEFIHRGEEPVLVPSHTIFFSGCTFSCVFCQNADISQHIVGYYIQPDVLVDIIHKRFHQGIQNVNWVGGDPTPNISYILQVLHLLDKNIPQIWNSNMYCSVESMNLLKGIIDVYLTDFKFGNDTCAKKLADVNHYCNIIQRNHMLASKQGEMIIRHLVMPNHIECCSKPIIDWVSAHIPEVMVNVMGQYRPAYKASLFDNISQSVSTDEVEEVKRYAQENNVMVL